MKESQWKQLAAILVGALLLRLVVFGVDETEFVVLTTFGKPAGTIADAGLHVKLPWQSRRSFDRRLQLYRFSRPVYTQDKKAMEVDLYVSWRITDALKFLQTVSEAAVAEMRIQTLVLDAVNTAVGQLQLASLINTDPAELGKSEQRFAAMARLVNVKAREDFGIEVADVRVQRLAFPKENKDAVFARMRAERERIAKQYRAEGQEQALKIRAEADREKERILSEAYREAERTKGDGDAESTRIYGAAHSADPEFYRMTRTLEAYKKVLDKDTTAILAADSELLRLLTQGRTAAAKR